MLISVLETSILGVKSSWTTIYNASYLIDEQVGHRRKSACHSLEPKGEVFPTDADLEVTDFHLAGVIIIVECEHDAHGHVLNVYVEASTSGKSAESRPIVIYSRILKAQGISRILLCYILLERLGKH